MRYQPPPDAAEFAVEHYDRGEFPAEDLQQKLDEEKGQGWRTVGGAPALVDFETGSILAGCPGLEGEDLDDLGEDEDPEHRAERRRRQEQAERDGWESQETKDARELWKQAKEQAPDALTIIRIGDEFYAFGEDAKVLQQSLQMGDGQTASFDEEHLGTHVEDLANDGRLIKVFERTEEGGLREATPEEAEPDPWDVPEPKPYKPPRARMTRGIRQAAAEYLGPGYDQDDVQSFAEVANDVANERFNAERERNDILRQVVASFVGNQVHDDNRHKGELARFVQAAKRAEDPDELQRMGYPFDEILDSITRNNHALSGYVRDEDDLFQMLQQGMGRSPRVTDDDLHTAYQVWHSAKSYQPAHEEGEPIPFSRRAAALLAERYGRQRLAPGVYETEAMGKRVALLMRRGANGYVWVAKPIVDTPQGPMLGKTFMGRRTLERLEYALKQLENLT